MVRLRKSLNFDLSTKMLKEKYPHGDWHNAYKYVRKFLEKNGFEHIQGSGYHSISPMDFGDVMDVMYLLKKELSWIEDCARVITLTDVPIEYDITDALASHPLLSNLPDPLQKKI